MEKIVSTRYDKGWGYYATYVDQNGIRYDWKVITPGFPYTFQAWKRLQELRRLSYMAVASVGEYIKSIYSRIINWHIGGYITMSRIISRTAGVPAATRGNTKFGQVFSYLDKAGNVKSEQFLQIGSSDKHYSIKASNGNLSSSPVAKGNKPIAVVGSFKVVTTFFKDIAKDSRKDFRAQLRMGDVFRAQKQGATYMHLGELDDGRFFALNLDTKDFATTGKGDKEVVVVGYGQFDVATV